ncbi:hypothetical protein CRENPOLYSF2_350002 [Crenothrix polyspora]|uniref:Uncharacterized protein n=1 Tax=Crenothrix polyspora TaxID=360316 RepID=A0A1R4HBR9_9GAMM|nr:hypothetical protein CRENPOLYSF2_350002 [Crenothrix polyspora]
MYKKYFKKLIFYSKRGSFAFNEEAKNEHKNDIFNSDDFFVPIFVDCRRQQCK